MTVTPAGRRIDSGSRFIRASPEKIYGAFLDPVAVASWRPPEGMTAKVYTFNPYPGGTFRMSFEYSLQHHEVSGKTSDHADVFHGKFLELVPHERIVELTEFESADPAFAGEMKITTTFTGLTGGTQVSIACENVPDGIRPEDHAVGIQSTLDNLAKFVE